MHQWHSQVVWAAERGDWGLARQLIDEGHDVEERGHCGWTALGMAAAHGHLDTMRLLVEQKGADLEARDDDGRTALLWAAASGKLEALDYLIARGARFDQAGSDERQRQALAWAAQNGFAAVVERLAALGADVRVADAGGETPMSLAISRTRWNVAAVLADLGAEVPDEHAARFTEKRGAGQPWGSPGEWWARSGGGWGGNNWSGHGWGQRWDWHEAG
mmetsp:Transcript_78677/g.222399  ORF Transcript_78677/g.222399 Transcript_78677/m.222399 type:complete len:218 (-) Transcript_78677:148-801(-)